MRSAEEYTAELEIKLLTLAADLEEARQKSLIQITKYKNQVESMKLEMERLRGPEGGE